MPQFYFLDGRWMSVNDARKFRRIQKLLSQRFCWYCNSRGNTHKKECPTKDKVNFDPNTAIKVDMENNPI